MKTRLQKLIEKENITPARFAEIVGVQRSSVSHILSGRNNPSLDFIQKILSAFPRVSTDWLITGEGNIYKKDSRTDIANQERIALEEISVKESTGNTLFSVLSDDAYRSKSGGQTPKQDEEMRISQEIDNDNNLQPHAIIDNAISNKPTVEKIVVFYTNNTFSEYLPR